MKRKILIMALAAFIAGGAAFAQDLGIGAGLDLGVGNLAPKDGAKITDDAFGRPRFSYENSDLVEGLELYAELGVPLAYKAEEFLLGLDLTLYGKFNLELTPGGTFFVALESSTDFDFTKEGLSAVFPGNRGGLFRHVNYGGRRVADGGIIGTGLGFGLGYTHDLDTLVIFVKTNTAFFLGGNGENALKAFDDLYVDFSTGIELPLDALTFGFSAGLKMNMLAGGEMNSDNLLKEVTATPSVKLASIPLYMEVAVGIPLVKDGLKSEGMSITPEFQYDIMDNFNVYLNVPIQGVAAEGDKMQFGVGLGTTFKF
ncbi:MAG: hypothetical protein FWD91_02420 [Treponema sp.]|nr:hypothetical protein [Treponema sp.]